MPAQPNIPEDDALREARRAMVEHQLASRDITDTRVLEAFTRVPRHLFVPEGQRFDAYEDHPVHIGCGQTISQPYIVALMTQALALRGGEKVLEIGTGSGYQTAILAELADKVYSVERIAELSERAAGVLKSLGYANVECLVADGTLGLPAHAPYDAILVAAAAPEAPKSLVEELAPAGRLVIPVGTYYNQMLTLVTRTKTGVRTEDLCPCIFVRLIGREGFEESDLT